MPGKATFTLVCILILVIAAAGSAEQNISAVPGNEHANVSSVMPASTPLPTDIINTTVQTAGENPAGLPDAPGKEDQNLTQGQAGPGQGNATGANGTAAVETGDSIKQEEETANSPYADREVIVRYRSVPGKKTDTSVATKANNAIGASVRKDYTGNGLPGTQVVTIPVGLSVEQAVAMYAENPDVLSVEPNYRIELMQIPDDPEFALQWALSNTGQTGGLTGTDIGAIPAWNISTGGEGILLAIPDTGIDLNHPDLAGNIWTNPDEIPGNGIDDDGNGYIDDVHGWNFVNNSPVPTDDNGHGTYVAGIAGAVGNNGIGISGVMWDAKILPLKVIGPEGYGYESDAIDAILYAKQQGARGHLDLLGELREQPGVTGGHRKLSRARSLCRGK